VSPYLNHGRLPIHKKELRSPCQGRAAAR
jgi:hypothetical protein